MKKTPFLSAIVSLVLAGAANAGQQTTVTLSDLQVLGGTPTVNITYTNPDGSGSITENGVYAGPQVNGGSMPGPFLYCIDLWHDNYIGSTYNLVTPPSTPLTFPTSFSNPDNMLGWLLTQDQSSSDSRAAVQLAMWYVIDNPGVNNPTDISFSFTGGDSTLTSDYAKLIAGIGIGQGQNYVSTETYTATFLEATTANQNLVSGGSFEITSVPEPGGLVLGTISALVLAGFYGWRRRRIA